MLTFFSLLYYNIPCAMASNICIKNLGYNPITTEIALKTNKGTVISLLGSATPS